MNSKFEGPFVPTFSFDGVGNLESFAEDLADLGQQFAVAFALPGEQESADNGVEATDLLRMGENIYRAERKIQDLEETVGKTTVSGVGYRCQHDNLELICGGIDMTSTNAAVMAELARAGRVCPTALHVNLISAQQKNKARLQSLLAEEQEKSLAGDIAQLTAVKDVLVGPQGVFSTFDKHTAGHVLDFIKRVLVGWANSFWNGELLPYVALLASQGYIYVNAETQLIQKIALGTVIYCIGHIIYKVYHKFTGKTLTSWQKLSCGSILDEIGKTTNPRANVVPQSSVEGFDLSNLSNDLRLLMRWGGILLLTVSPAGSITAITRRLVRNMKDLKELDGAVIEIAAHFGVDLTEDTGIEIMIKTLLDQAGQFETKEMTAMATEDVTAMETWVETVNRILASANLSKKAVPLAHKLSPIIVRLRETKAFLVSQSAVPAPVGILFWGPPGTGKSYIMERLAKDIAKWFRLPDKPSQIFDLKAGGAHYVPYAGQPVGKFDEIGQELNPQSTSQKATDLLTILDGFRPVCPTASLEGKAQSPAFLAVMLGTNRTWNSLSINLGPEGKAALRTRLMEIYMDFENPTPGDRHSKERRVDFSNIRIIWKETADTEVRLTYDQLSKLIISKITERIHAFVVAKQEVATYEAGLIGETDIPTDVLERIMRGDTYGADALGALERIFDDTLLVRTNRRIEDAEAEEEYRRAAPATERPRRNLQPLPPPQAPMPSLIFTPGRQRAEVVPQAGEAEDIINVVLPQASSTTHVFLAPLALSSLLFIPLLGWWSALVLTPIWGLILTRLKIEPLVYVRAVLKIAKNEWIRRFTIKGRNTPRTLPLMQPPNGNRILYIYGPAGVGKTTNIQRALKNRGDSYVMISSLEQQYNPDSHDVYVFDDVVLFSKENQEAYMQHVNRLTGKLIIILSNLTPWNLTRQEERETPIGWWRRTGWFETAYTRTIDVGTLDIVDYECLLYQQDRAVAQGVVYGIPEGIEYHIDLYSTGPTDVQTKRADRFYSREAFNHIDLIQEAVHGDRSFAALTGAMVTLGKRLPRLRLRFVCPGGTYCLVNGTVFHDYQDDGMELITTEGGLQLRRTRTTESRVYTPVQLRLLLNGDLPESDFFDNYLVRRFKKSVQERDEKLPVFMSALGDANLPLDHLPAMVNRVVKIDREEQQEQGGYVFLMVLAIQAFLLIFSRSKSFDIELAKGKGKGKKSKQWEHNGEYFYADDLAAAWGKGKWSEAYDRVARHRGFRNYEEAYAKDPDFANYFSRIADAAFTIGHNQARAAGVVTHAPDMVPYKGRGRQQGLKIVDKNSVRIEYRELFGARNGMGFMITSRIGITAWHMVGAGTTTVFHSTGEFPVLRTVRMGNTDTALFITANPVSGVSDACHMIPPPEEIRRLKTAGPFLYNNGDKEYTQCHVTRQSGELVNSDGTLISDTYYEGSFPASSAVPGSSGSPWITWINGQVRVVGTHIGRGTTERTVLKMSPISTMTISETVEVLMGGSDVELQSLETVAFKTAPTVMDSRVLQQMKEPRDEEYHPGTNWVPVGRVGGCTRSDDYGEKCHQLRAAFRGFERVHDNAKHGMNADLTDDRYPKDENGRTHVLSPRLTKANDIRLDTPELPARVFEKTAEQLAIYYHRHLPGTHMRPMSDKELFAPSEFNKINLNSGAGPSLQLIDRSIASKGTVLTRDEDGVVTWCETPAGQTARQVYEKAEASLRENKVPMTTMATIKRKKELLPTEKTYKPRPYYEVDMINVLQERKRIGPIQRTFIIGREHHGICLDVDHHSEGPRMFEWLRNGGKNTIGTSLDVSAFDNVQGPPLLRAASTFLWQFAKRRGYTEEDIAQLKALLAQREDNLYILDGVVYRVRGTLASGMYATNFTDSVIWNIVFVAMLENHIGRAISMEEFFANFRLLICGDDLTFTTNEDWKDRIDFPRLVKEYKAILNWTVTDGGDKNVTVPQWYPLMELVFCSRNFYKLETGHIVMALKDASLSKMTLWASHYDHEIKMLEHAAVARELVSRGRETYDRFCEDYEAYWGGLDMNIVVRGLPPYEEALDAWVAYLTMRTPQAEIEAVTSDLYDQDFRSLEIKHLQATLNRAGTIKSKMTLDSKKLERELLKCAQHQKDLRPLLGELQGLSPRIAFYQCLTSLNINGAPILTQELFSPEGLGLYYFQRKGQDFPWTWIEEMMLYYPEIPERWVTQDLSWLKGRDILTDEEYRMEHLLTIPNHCMDALPLLQEVWRWNRSHRDAPLTNTDDSYHGLNKLLGREGHQALQELLTRLTLGKHEWPTARYRDLSRLELPWEPSLGILTEDVSSAAKKLDCLRHVDLRCLKHSLKPARKDDYTNPRKAIGAWMIGYLGWMIQGFGIPWSTKNVMLDRLWEMYVALMNGDKECPMEEEIEWHRVPNSQEQTYVLLMEALERPRIFSSILCNHYTCPFRLECIPALTRFVELMDRYYERHRVDQEGWYDKSHLWRVTYRTGPQTTSMYFDDCHALSPITLKTQAKYGDRPEYGDSPEDVTWRRYGCPGQDIVDLHAGDIVVNDGSPTPHGAPEGMNIKGAVSATHEDMPQLRDIGSPAITVLALPSGYEPMKATSGQFLTDLKDAAYRPIGLKQLNFSVNQSADFVLFSERISPWNKNLMSKYAAQYADAHTGFTGEWATVKYNIAPTPNARGEIAFTLVPSSAGPVDTSQLLDRQKLTLYETVVVNIATGASLEIALNPGKPYLGAHRDWINRDENEFYGQLIIWTHSKCNSTFNVEIEFAITMEVSLSPLAFYINPDNTVGGYEVGQPPVEFDEPFPFDKLMGIGIDGAVVNYLPTEQDDFISTRRSVANGASVIDSVVVENYEFDSNGTQALAYVSAPALGNLPYSNVDFVGMTNSQDTPSWITSPATEERMTVITTSPALDISAGGYTDYKNGVSFVGVGGSLSSDGKPVAPFPSESGGLWATSWPEEVQSTELRVTPFLGRDVGTGTVEQVWYGFNTGTVVEGQVLRTPDGLDPLAVRLFRENDGSKNGKINVFATPVAQTSNGGRALPNGYKALFGILPGSIVLGVTDTFSGSAFVLDPELLRFHFRLAEKLGDRVAVWRYAFSNGNPFGEIMWSREYGFAVNTASYRVSMSIPETLIKVSVNTYSNYPQLLPLSEDLSWSSRVFVGAFPVKPKVEKMFIRYELERLPADKTLQKKRSKTSCVTKKDTVETHVWGALAGMAGSSLGSSLIGGGMQMANTAVSGKFAERLQSMIGDQNMEAMKYGGKLMKDQMNMAARINAAEMGLSSSALNGINQITSLVKK
jgi:GTPase SAR1 family protein